MTASGAMDRPTPDRVSPSPVDGVTPPPHTDPHLVETLPWSNAGAVIALKATADAKSRLGSLPDPLRRRLAWTMAVDTLRAVSSTVASVVVVSDQPGLATALRAYDLEPQVLAESGRHGLNAALTLGADHLRTQGSTLVFACVGDLPALSSRSLHRILASAARLPRCFVADASGVGTTMLLSTTAPLEPRFSGESASAHQESGAVPLVDELVGRPMPDARRDVDCEADLRDAVHLGVGAATAALFDPESSVLGTYRTITVAGPADGHRSAITADGYRVTVPVAAVDPQLRSIATGQRLHAVTSGARVLSAWL